jgi:hypothetical protein
MQHR